MKTKELDDCQKASSSSGSKSTPIGPETARRYEREGKSILLGRYPQTRVDATDENGLSSIEFDESTWTNYGYLDAHGEEDCMYYIDVDTDGDGRFDYRGVYIVSYRDLFGFLEDFVDDEDCEDDPVQCENGYSTDTIYWFKYDPIRWTILKEKDGKALIMADLITDSQDYDMEFNDYVESHIRKWLNDTFYGTAFSDLERSIILTTEVDNSASTTASGSDYFVCANTNDKVFLLSYEEAVEYFSDDASRRAKSTDYAKCQGASVYDGIGYWWLRSPNEDYGIIAYYVYYDGNLRYDYVYFTFFGVRAACWINL